MPRYFFHSSDGQRQIDQEGTILEDDHAARVQAVKLAGEWAKEHPVAMIANEDCRIEVAGDGGVLMFSVIIFTVDPRSFGKGR